MRSRRIDLALLGVFAFYFYDLSEKLRWLNFFEGIIECSGIAFCTQTENYTHGFIGKIRVMSKCFTGMNIRQMHFNKRYCHAKKGITHCKPMGFMGDQVFPSSVETDICMEPSSGLDSPPKILSNDDLPAPLRPISPIRSLLSNEKSA